MHAVDYHLDIQEELADHFEELHLSQVRQVMANVDQTA